MTKRVFRYFFDFIDGQETWLNEMAAKGWRLVKCGQISYEFEECSPGKYEYAVEFVAEKSYSKSKDYKAFLESMGYQTFYKNINVGIFIGKAKWRPWGEGAGQIVTAPGGLQKELIIVEKKKDGKPFELHTDLTDALTMYKKIRTGYLWAAGGLLALAVMFLSYAIVMPSVYMALGAVFFMSLSLLWLMPGLKTDKKIRKLKEESQLHEYEAGFSKKKAWKMIAVVMAVLLFGTGLFWVINSSGGFMPSSYSARWKTEASWKNHWSVSYRNLNGYMQRGVSLGEGGHTFTIEITTEAGEISLSIMGKDGTEYYKGSELSTSVFEVEVDGKGKAILRVDAKNHSGSYKINWD